MLKVFGIMEEQLIKEAAEYANKGNLIDPAYANGLFYGFTAGAKSKWVEAEKIKAQIEAIRAADTYGIGHMLKYYEQKLNDYENM